MKITSQQLNISHLSANEQALSRCERALELKDKGDYAGTQSVMSPLWRFGERPNLEGLHAPTVAEVLLCVGVLTGWIGSKNQIYKAQETAKDLITESMEAYAQLGDTSKVAAARAELAYCYWRQGALNEARIMFDEALQRLTTPGNTRARALLRLSIVEWSASHYDESFRILSENAFLFERIGNASIKGAYHSQMAMLLRSLAKPGNSEELLMRAVKEYQAADSQFKLARNILFRANVKNNLACLLYKLNKFKDALDYLQQARKLVVNLRDKVEVAQIDDTRAQIFIAQKKLSEAERTARSAVSGLEKSGRQCLLADALITHGIALARMGQSERAQHVFERAIDVAHEVGALNKAGLAALTLIEELDQAPTDILCVAFDRAADWLADAQSDEILRRVNKAARKIFIRLRGEIGSEEATEVLLNPPRNLQTQVLNYERQLIRHALARTNGRLVRAAELLGTSYQGLGYIIQARHQDLLNERSPVRRRGKRKSE